MRFIVLFSCLWVALVSSEPGTNSSLTPQGSRKCLDSNECLDLDLRSCDCGPEMVCIIKERTCDVCPTLDCVREPERAAGNTAPIIAVSVVAGVILLLSFIISFLYYRNREEVTARGGVVAYIKYKAQRDSILKQEFNDDQVLLSKRSTVLSENKRSSVASMFLTAKSSNLNTRVQPKVVVLGSDAASITNMDTSMESGVIPKPLPHDGPSFIDPSASILNRESFGLSSFGIMHTSPPTPALSRESRVYSTAESQFRPLSNESFATQILSNPLVSAGLTPRSPSISNAFFAAQGAAHNISLSPPPPSADPRNSQVLPSEDSIILHYK
ncbi:hypothetical protein DSO57_1036104 [Entomophthora muscae]|uniref:Uncharacterized protein n=2 Tax=Entomophthora muscae TaxID=34485 RepID=A0ACC2SCC6_9FUNG|nr:hypothetical protein DSO57_1036104 [Entomophthora muscae]